MLSNRAETREIYDSNNLGQRRKIWGKEIQIYSRAVGPWDGVSCENPGGLALIFREL